MKPAEPQEVANVEMAKKEQISPLIKLNPNNMKTPGIDDFAKRLDDIFDQGMITKAQILDAYNKYASRQTEITDEEIEKQADLHFQKYSTDNAIWKGGVKWLCDQFKFKEPEYDEHTAKLIFEAGELAKKKAGKIKPELPVCKYCGLKSPDKGEKK
jgi:hypothetical protein